MEDETSQAIVGDSVASALEEHRRKRRFGWRKKPKKQAAPLTHCENCGEELRGRYCSNCGQAAVSYHRSFRHVVVDVLDSFLNWDSKFIRSIGLLLWKPGWLTNQFLEGKRVRFVHPLRLYLLVSIVFFLCARLIPVNDTRSIKLEDMTPEQRAVFDTKMTKLKEKQKKKHSIFSFSSDDQKKDKPAATATPSPAEGATPSASESAAPAEQTSPTEAQATPTPPELDAAISELVNDRIADKTTEKQKNGPHLRFGSDNHEAKTPFEIWLQQRVKDQIGENGERAKLFLQTLRSNLSTMMLFCIPLFAFILKILYLRQKRFYIEHLVYALNIHAFFYLATILVVLISIGLHRVIPGAPQVLLTLLLSLLVFVQIFISIRRVYGQAWFMSLFKFAFGGFIYIFVIVLGVAATAFVTLALPS
jgi:ribosomal protein L32